MIEKGKENYLKKFFSLGLRSVNGVRYNRCKAKNVTFYYKMLHFLLFIITIILLWILDIPGKSLSCGMCLIIFSTAKEYSMGTTQPIRNKNELAAFRMYYKDIHPNRRNYCLIVMGLNTALRISDLLKLKWDNVYN